MTDHVVARAAELGEGERVVTVVEGKEVVVFNHGGEYFAYLNWCAHQSGPCGEGTLTGTYEATYDRETRELDLRWGREGEILNCPWHGWEYDVTTGECLSRRGISLPSFPVTECDGDVVVSV